MDFLKSVHTQNLQNPGQTVVEGEGLFETGNKKICADCDPDLGSYGVVRGSEEGLDPQVLLDPFEEQLDLPSALVDQRNGQCRDGKVVGKEDQILAGFLVEEMNSTQGNGISFLGQNSAQTNSLVAAQSGGFGNSARLPDMEVEVAFGPDYEERSGLDDAEKSTEIEVSAIHYINGSWRDWHAVEERHIVFPSLRNVDEQRDRALKLELGVDLHSRFRRTKVCPGEERHAQVDGARIDRNDHAVETKRIGFVRIQAASFADQNLGQSFVDTPVPVLVGVSQIGASDFAPKTHRISELIAPQTRFDVAQSFPISELSEDHREILIACGKASADPRHRVAFDAPSQFFRVQNICDLSENESSGVHPLMRMNQTLCSQPFQMQDNPFFS